METLDYELEKDTNPEVSEMATKINQLIGFKDNLSSYYENENDKTYLEILNTVTNSINTLRSEIKASRFERLDNFFMKFPKTVYSLARTAGKNIKFVYNLPQISIQKNILEAIYEPISHLCETFIFHGVEEEEIRITSGKPITSILKLSAYHLDDELTIKIESDGSGVNTFGFQSEVITLQEVPLRLKNIHKDIKSINGSMTIETRPGIGTKVFITIPTNPTKKNTL